MQTTVAGKTSAICQTIVRSPVSYTHLDVYKRQSLIMIHSKDSVKVSIIARTHKTVRSIRTVTDDPFLFHFFHGRDNEMCIRDRVQRY